MRNLAEVPEADAAPRVAAVYDDIRAMLGTSFVNLVYRHLATDPAMLEWAWHAIRPRLADGNLASQAMRVRQTVARQCEAWPRRGPRSSPLDQRRGDARLTLGLISSYNQANALNLMSLAHLLRNPPAAGALPVDADPEAGEASIGATTVGARAGGLGQASLPPLPPMARMSEDERRQIDRINRYGETGTPAIMASLYRHLAACPGALAFAEEILAPLEERGLLALGRESTAREASRIAAFHSLAMPSPPDDLESHFGTSLRQLRDVTISKMIPIGHALALAIGSDSLD